MWTSHATWPRVSPSSSPVTTSSATDRLLEQLNPAQQEAVRHGTGPLLVLAGAGSGKTRVLTFRFAHLIAREAAQPHEITAVTFTNKAAREMRERVEKLLDGDSLSGGGSLRGGFVGTFHRWALESLRRYPREAGLARGFSILDSDDQRNLVTRAMRELGHDSKQVSPRTVLGLISARVNSGERPTSDGRLGDPFDLLLSNVWLRYQELKTEAAAIDFDDMLVCFLDLLREHAGIREIVRRRCAYLLVDEFQDTNSLQLDLLKEVVSEQQSITAVGDEDQSIYRWRGAEMDNILSFERHFSDARVVKLEQNYRSTQPILGLSGHLISCNVQRRGKRLFTERQGGEPVRLYVGPDERAEARWAADRIEELCTSYRLDNIAVLMRTNAQSRPFEEELTRRQLAYRVVGGLRFWQRAEVKDALAYLRLIMSPDDLIAFRRVVNVPARGIGAGTIDILQQFADANDLGLPAAARQLPEQLMPRARQSLQVFFALLDEARDRRRDLAPGELVGWLLEASGLLSLYDSDDPEKAVRRENLHQLTAAVSEASALGQGLDDFLDAVALLEEGDDEKRPEVISLMTLHAAKGLEFDVVFLAGLEDGLLPHASSRNEPDGLEEERRLAYVGMTRARRWLGLTAAQFRFIYGKRQQTVPSRFLRELPADSYKDVSDVPLSFTLPQPDAGYRQPDTEYRQPVDRAVPAPASSPGAEPGRSPQQTTRKSGRKLPPAVTDANGIGWRAGNRVRHRRFGSGVVLSCQGRGPNLRLVIYFDRIGRKTLVPTVAKLEQI